MTHLPKLLSAVAMVSSLIACGVATEETSTTKIVGGRLVENGDLEVLSTVALTSRGRAFCSGTLIRENVVVTAGHCLGGRTPDITFGLSDRTGTTVRASRAIRNPEGFDVGLVILAEAPPSWARPVTILEDDFVLEAGDPLILAGFGQTSGSGGSSGRLKTVTTIFDQISVEAKEVWFGPTPGLSACRGDSGGPMYVKKSNEIGEDSLFLLGSTIGGFRPPACSGSGRYADSRAHRDWILSVIGE
ncbi:MAG: trypsin-like serine protease [Pseudobacteriovorax sp.]|nr:trypsin-like serine protease [Pseudobacteriovorax sp.]